MVVSANLTLRHLVQALLNNSQALSHLLHAHQVPVVDVAPRADRNLKVHVRVGVVRLRLSQVPLDAGAAQHDPAEAQVQRVLSRHHADVDGARSPNAVGCDQVLDLLMSEENIHYNLYVVLVLVCVSFPFSFLYTTEVRIMVF